MRVLPSGPAVQNEIPETRQLQAPVRSREIADGMLHEGVGGDDEVARQPGTDKDCDRRQPVRFRAQPFLSVEK